MTHKPEHNIQCEAVTAIRALGIGCVAIPNANHFTPRAKAEGVEWGASDLLLVLPPFGRAGFIEMKNDAKKKRTGEWVEKFRDNQIAFMDQMESFGALAYRTECRSAADAKRVALEWLDSERQRSPTT